MPRNFNTEPYYDDFDASKNFHRILFKPNVAVQARELTQAQTILQDQITKFADNVFKQNSPVTGGQVTTNLNCHYIKLQDTYLGGTYDVSQFEGKLIQDATGEIVARVIKTAASSGTGVGDPNTLVVSYKSGTHFSDNDIIYDSLSNQAVQAITSNATGLSSVVSIAQGVFYISSNYTDPTSGLTISNGTFVQVNPDTIILDKYSNAPSARVGLNITETIEDYVSDVSLLDPAVGASNYQAPGADRYKIKLGLETRPLTFGDDDGFIELVRVENGNVAKLVDGSVYGVIDDYFAKRDYETNGDYVVNDFKLTPKTNDDASKYTLSVGKGLAYVHGYRVDNPAPVEIISNRARTTASQNNSPTFIDFGSYFYVDSAVGSAGDFFDITTTQKIDLHCVPVGEIKLGSEDAYNTTKVASGYIRGLVYDHNTNDADTTTYVYKAYVNNLQNSVVTDSPANDSALANEIEFGINFSDLNNAYVGVNISIIAGPGAGDFRTITAYDGVTKVATVNQPWTELPTTSSIFSLNFDTKDIETITTKSSTSFPTTIAASAKINAEGRVGGISTGNTILENPTVPEMIFPVGSPYVSTLKNASYTSQQVFRNVSFTASGGGVSAQLNYEGDYTDIIKHFGAPNSTLSHDIVKQNYTVVVVNKGTNTLIENGDIVSWAVSGRTVSLDNDASIATFYAGDLSPFTAIIIAKVYVENADNTGHVLKGKNLIQANTATVNISGTTANTYTHVDDTSLTSTGQVYIENAGLVSPGYSQSLYLSDVKSIVKIIDTKDPGTIPTVSMITNSSYDVTSNYIFDNGQRDNFYDHASIKLRPGAPQPKGNLLVLLNYYQHTGGDGYFSVVSYVSTGVSSLPEDYQQIPNYASSQGTIYALRDCLDFRPARKNAQTDFIYRYANSADSRHGALLPVDLSLFTTDYSFYLGRKDKLVLTKDRNFQLVEGSPSLTPILPTEPDGSLVVANITHKPYTGFIPSEAPVGFMSDLSIDKLQHKRYTMQDIAGLENRINNIEYYTSLNALEQNASSMQISDAYGLNRFKNGILVDDFSSYATADTFNNDYLATINRRTRQLTASQTVENFPLKSLALAYNMGAISDSSHSGLGYKINSDGLVNYFTLPLNTTTPTKSVIEQKWASRVTNVNPFSVSNAEGVTTLTPNVDIWVDKNYSPSLLITDPNLQVFRSSNDVNVLSVGDWQTVSGTTTSTTSSATASVTGNPVEGHNKNWSPFGYVGYIPTTTTTTSTTVSTTTLLQQQTSILGPYSNIGNTYSLNNGYITDISILPWIRAQQVVVKSKGLLTNAILHATFDGVNIDPYIRKANIIELTNVSGTFVDGDVIGYTSSGTFYGTARILGTYVYPSTVGTSDVHVRLYVAADPNTSQYSNSSTLKNGKFDESGNYQSSDATGTISSSSHFGARVIGINSTTPTINLSPLASSTNEYYTGNTIYIPAGTGVGQSANIVSYNGTTKVATLDSAITGAVGDIYSIGSFKTNEVGDFYGIFNIPENTFHTGERILRLDNSINGNKSSATTFTESSFYAQGLSTNAQQIDFGASPSGAKGTFTRTSNQTVTSTGSSSSSSSVTSYSRWDPVAQTFIIDEQNYPNGIFIDSVKFFFRTKPTLDKAPITLSIVGTLNGYPNGTTLDHSIVTLQQNEVNVSETPHYLDDTTYTTFKFPVPIYIQPSVLYSFILKSNSNEYTMWTAANGDTAVSSSIKNLPTDVTPTTITKISSAPYVGGLFISQNAQTWTADQNQSLMFVVDRCVFDTAATPQIQFIVPNKLPQRTLIDQSVEYYTNANNISSTLDSISYEDILVDAFNITTTDFSPTTTNVNYSYKASLLNGSTSPTIGVNPGKYGTSMYDNIYLNDGNGERKLIANSNSSFSLFANLTSNDPAVSPIISDAGLSTYAIKWNINNCELSNSNITLISGGTGYSQTTQVTVSAPTGQNGSQAYAAANVVSGVIESIYFTDGGSGYITTPTLTITDPALTGAGADAFITGETSPNGGNALTKYVTKKVSLDAGFDSGDLNVYITAYRPVNTDILVYYKILNRNDTQKFDDGEWQLMNMIDSSSALYSSTRNDTHEYVFAPGTGGKDQGYVTYTSTNGQTYTSFSQFAIKVVMTSSDHTFTPFATDLRCIALPANVNTTF